MNISKLKQSEQLLLAIVITVLVLGIYSFFRLVPEFQDISSLERKMQSTQAKLLKARLPNEPENNVDDLLAELDDQEQAITLTKSMAEKVQARLAPIDSQELKVLVSQLARDLKIRIVANERIVTKAIVPVISGKKKKKATKPTAVEPLYLPENYSWLDRVATNSIFYRPVQRIEVAGEYKSIRGFIHQLDNLPWQVTVIKIKVERQPITPLRGYAQALKAELYLAI